MACFHLGEDTYGFCGTAAHTSAIKEMCIEPVIKGLQYPYGIYKALS
jgi:hypothetical protein